MVGALIGLLIGLAILGLIVTNIFDAIARPTIRRLAMRNVSRRRGEAALVMLGSLLGTAIITGAFVVGDTVGASFRDQARTELGPIDEAVRSIGLNKNQPVLDALKANPVPGTDGLLPMTRAGVSVATTGDEPRAEPFAGINEVDFDAARAFGGDRGATGLADAGPTPTGNEAVITKSLAKKLGLKKPGSTIIVYGFANKTEMTVRQIIPTVGVGGFGNRSLFAAPGTIEKLLATGSAATPVTSTAEPPTSFVMVSNNGGVFDGAKGTDAVTKALNERVAAIPGTEVREFKQDTLDQAKDISDQFTQLFSFIGFFSVLAGVLLLINIFVMLADERKSELGMLRAVGLKRNQLVRAFGMEGAIYAVVSAVLGMVVGIGLGRVVATLAQGVFNQGGGGGGLTLRFAVEAPSLVTGFIGGALIALLTVWGTSFATGRMNVIRAIRDIPKPPADGAVRARTYSLSGVGIVLGLLNFRAGVSSDAWFGVLAGVPIAAWCSIPVLRPIIGRRFAIVAGCGVAMVWAIAVFSLFPDALSSTEFGAFIVQGIVLVGSAVVIVATNADVATWAVSKLRVNKRTLAARLGFAYPLNRVFRTAMLLGMYAIVIFTITFLSVFSELFAAQAPQYARDSAAGYNILVDSNYSNPVPSSALLDDPDVAADATLDQAFPKWTTRTKTEPESWQMTGFDDALLARGVPKLNDRLARFASDRAAWEAVKTDPSLVILSNFFLQRGGPPEGGLDIGDKVKVYDTVSGRVATLTVAGKLDSDFLFNGPMVGKAFMQSFSSDLTPSRHYVAVKPGANPELVAQRLEGRLLNFGVQADTFQNFIEDALKTQQGFMALMRGYLGLGLIIGIAGLGVVMVRAVRERRRQIGMLRAMGFPNRLVRQAFLTESAFIAITGIAIGTVLALITAYSLLTNSDTFGGQNIQFKIPSVSIAVVSVVALAASLIAASFPASQASKIKPAVALRIAD